MVRIIFLEIMVLHKKGNSIISYLLNVEVMPLQADKTDIHTFPLHIFRHPLHC